MVERFVCPSSAFALNIGNNSVTRSARTPSSSSTLAATAAAAAVVQQGFFAADDFLVPFMHRRAPEKLYSFAIKKMMKRKASIEALLKAATADFIKLKTAYDSSLHEKHVQDDLKVLIKNVFENLRACMDYLAHDTFETLCAGAKKPERLYFPIRPTALEFAKAISKDDPGLKETAKAVYDLLESVQPYRDPWLGQFNKLNNHNKHQDLVEQTRTEARQVTVSRRGDSVS